MEDISYETEISRLYEKWNRLFFVLNIEIKIFFFYYYFLLDRFEYVYLMYDSVFYLLAKHAFDWLQN